MLTNAQTKAYLDRIGFTGPVELTLQTLNRLIQAHLTHVPFEALDVWGVGACPSLELQDLYKKVIVDRRGGYCFELNTLFRKLLNALGFDAYQVIASLLDENGQAAPPAHNVILCMINGQTYFVDVGFGGPVPFGALKLNSEQDGFSVFYEDGFYIFSRTEDGKLRPALRFRDVPAELCELIPLNFYISQRPDVHFRNRILVNQRQPDGSVYTLIGEEFKITDCGGVQSQPVDTIEQVKHILQQYFSIDPTTAQLRKSL